MSPVADAVGGFVVGYLTCAACAAARRWRWARWFVGGLFLGGMVCLVAEAAGLATGTSGYRQAWSWWIVIGGFTGAMAWSGSARIWSDGHE